MKMTKYLAKKILNEKGEIQDLSIRYRVDTEQLPDSRYMIVYGDSFTYPKAKFQDNEWIIVEDKEKKLTEENRQNESNVKRSEMKEKKQQLKALIKDIADPSKNFNLNDLKRALGVVCSMVEFTVKDLD